MKKILLIIAALSTLSFSSLRADGINIIPRPASVEALPGTFVPLVWLW